eukprot:TRINITY_DN3765_c0_g1_i8.p2 TRINITY_DN3765_c0_g1~~TRINITY_DN3765_c0_g1_i8.p2  ORF type:complete len:103 (+),score=16.36 TRINITY_DN3765_c0_g1_i8:224-532(+)
MGNKKMKITLTFKGGLEDLLKGVENHELELEAGASMEVLVARVRDTLFKTNTEIFAKGKSVRPGILVLVNDTDWELLGEIEYRLQPGDNITFFSTLHGGQQK